MATKSKSTERRAERPTTKKAQLIRMISTKAGADVETISRKLGWQAHTTRAAITGLKKAGFAIGADKAGGKPTRYRIVADTEGADADSRRSNSAPAAAHAG